MIINLFFIFSLLRGIDFTKQSNVQPPKTVQTAPVRPTVDISALADVIGAAESDEVGGYNAANAGYPMDLGRDGLISLSGRPCEQITLGEIKKWQQRGLLYAVGRYQLVPRTLKEAAKFGGIPDSAPFSPATQDKLLIATIKIKRPTVLSYLQGKTTRDAAMLALAKEWAGLPTPSGKSYYQGVNGNRAHVTVSAVHKALAETVL